MLAQLIDGENETQEFIQALLEHELIEAMSFDITFEDQSEQRIQGVYTINEEKLNNLSDEALITLHKKSMLKPIYTMIASMGHVYSLIQRKNERLKQA